MKLRTVVRDCLFLNWALPAEALPEAPAPLRYQRHAWQGSDYVFASALLFHHDAVRWSAFPLVRVAYPQLNVRLYVLDDDGVPSVLFLRELMPSWVAPGVRLVSHHPAASARLDFPRPSRQAGAGSWRWRAERGGTLTVRAWVHSPVFGPGPRIGGWEETVRYFQDRPRGYALHGGVLHRVDVSHPPAVAGDGSDGGEGRVGGGTAAGAGAAVWPLAAEVAGAEALLRRWPLADPAAGPGRDAYPAAAADGSWPPLHSSWLCPEMPFSIAFDLVPRVQPVVQRLPHPAAGRISSPALRAGSAPPPPVLPPRAPGETAARPPRAAVPSELGARAPVLASAA
jgi:Uncharacterized conserved protein (COG2071)